MREWLTLMGSDGAVYLIKFANLVNLIIPSSVREFHIPIFVIKLNVMFIERDILSILDFAAEYV